MARNEEATVSVTACDHLAKAADEVSLARQKLREVRDSRAWRAMGYATFQRYLAVEFAPHFQKLHELVVGTTGPREAAEPKATAEPTADSAGLDGDYDRVSRMLLVDAIEMWIDGQRRFRRLMDEVERIGEGGGQDPDDIIASINQSALERLQGQADANADALEHAVLRGMLIHLKLIDKPLIGDEGPTELARIWIAEGRPACSFSHDGETYSLTLTDDDQFALLLVD